MKWLPGLSKVYNAISDFPKFPDVCAVPSFNGTVVSFDLEGGRKHGKELRRISREMGAGKECGKTE